MTNTHLPAPIPHYDHPPTLFVGFKEYTIVQASLDKDDLYGCVEFERGIITVDPNQSGTDYRHTLLHEIIHVGYDMFGFGDDDEMPSFGNEFIVTITTNMFKLLVGLNAELFEFIWETE